jgi:hypothetical protein
MASSSRSPRRRLGRVSPKPEITYDPVLKRWKAHCSHCAYMAVRAKREAAEHILSQHTAYNHEGES